MSPGSIENNPRPVPLNDQLPLDSSRSWMVYNFFFRAFVFLVPQSPFLSSGALVTLLLVSFFTGKRRPIRAWAWKSGDLLAYMIVLAAGILYSTDRELGWKQVETSLSFIVLPIVWNLAPREPDLRRDLFYPFLAGITVAATGCLVLAGWRYAESGALQEFFYDQLTAPVGIQPTYFAYYLIFAITFALYLLHERELSLRGFHLAVVVFLFSVLFLSGGQSTFISIQLILAFFLLRQLTSSRENFRTSTFLLVLLTTLGFLAVNWSLRTDGLLQHVGGGSDSWDRMLLWKSAWDANTSLLWGVGTGDYNLVLGQYFSAHGLEDYAATHMNAHNQYLQAFFINGLIGLAVLTWLLVRPLYLAVRANHPMGVLLYFPFVIYGVTEVYLGRYQGVVFFVLLHQALVSYYYTPRPERWVDTSPEKGPN